jgi:pyruvate ferredoxin oxidoreductase alpha subunit
MNGNSAMAEALKQVCPDVVMSYPVTPAAALIEELASYAADGAIDTEFVNAESGVSALSGCIGASSAGARTFTATASQGLASMHEILMIASSLRLPVVAGIANRAMAAPATIYPDHSDTMAERDSGWIQIFSETPQEVYDNLIQAYKIAEHADVRTPLMVCMDGFITSHCRENALLEDSGDVSEFVGKPEPPYSVLDSEHPVTIGSVAMPDYYFEQRVNQVRAIENTRRIIKEVGREFGDRFGRYYGNFEAYKMEDAEYAVVLMSSAAGTAKVAIDQMRQRGEKVGLLKLRVFRPFPYMELQEALSGLTAAAVLDRSISAGGFGGPLFSEIRSALYDAPTRPMVFPYVYGLGGRDFGPGDVETVFKEIKDNSRVSEPEDEFKEKTADPSGVTVRYINLREDHGDDAEGIS